MNEEERKAKLEELRKATQERLREGVQKVSRLEQTARPEAIEKWIHDEYARFGGSPVVVDDD